LFLIDFKELEKSDKWIQAQTVNVMQNRISQRQGQVMRAILSKEQDESKKWIRMTTKLGIKIPRLAPPSIAITHGLDLLKDMDLLSEYHSLPKDLGVVGGYRRMVEVVKKRFLAMINDPVIVASLTFFKKNIILTSLFADAAPESKQKVMTNSYFRFLNFVGVGSSPSMMPWLNGGNFSEGSAAFEWLHKNVINKDIVELENLKIPVCLSKHPMKEVEFFVLPVGDLAYQSKVAGHQGCASKYFSVYWADVTKENGGDERKGMTRRDTKWMEEQVQKVHEKEKELKEDQLLTDKKRILQLQEYIKSECHNQSHSPWLLICERFIFV
jgi:hypothetical protein